MMPNANFSGGSQPPMTFDLSLSETAGSPPLRAVVSLEAHQNVQNHFQCDVMLVAAPRVPFVNGK